MIGGMSIVLVGLLLTGCATPTPPASPPLMSPAQAADPSVIPSVAPGAIRLDRLPDDFGCDAIGVPYRQVTFRVRVGAEREVTVVTETGAVLPTAWSHAFSAGDAADPVVRDGAGQAVATDGDVLVIPDAGWPRLHGYFVCPGESDISILAEDPA